MNNSVFPLTTASDSDLATAFVVYRGGGYTQLLTCNHAVLDPEKTYLVDRKEAYVLHRNPDLDIAVLSVSDVIGEPITFTRATSVSSALILGCSASDEEIRREPVDLTGATLVATAQNKNKPLVGHFRFEQGQPPTKGYSGSPVFERESSCVFAVLCRGEPAKGESARIYAVSFESIMQALPKELTENFEIATEQLPAKEFAVENAHSATSEAASGQLTAAAAYLRAQLEESLQSFEDQPAIWVAPCIHVADELSAPHRMAGKSITTNELVNDSRDFYIFGRQQYGMTSLGRHLCVVACDQRGLLWLFADTKSIKPYENTVEKWLTKELAAIGRGVGDIDTIIFDQYNSADKDCVAVVQRIRERVPNARTGKLLRSEYLARHRESEMAGNENELSVYHLWALPKNSVREIVHNYNGSRHVGDSDAVLETVVRDLTALNVPRTPLNCIMLLKIYEQSFDDSPVNRTELLHRVLFLIFNVKGLPDYKTQPDVKDAEYTLGWFCEGLVCNNSYLFSRSEFIAKIEEFCAHRQTEIDVRLIFDALYSNRIIEASGSLFQFRFSSWVSYFLSHRMRYDDDFRRRMLGGSSNSSYPEIMEFYSGTDRQRTDAVEQLTEVVRVAQIKVVDRFGLPSGFNPYALMRWNITDERMRELHKKLSDDVQVSNLPDVIKDSYADRSYDRSRPHSQAISTILNEYYVLYLMKAVSAGCRVLRNSDFVESDKRHALMAEILEAWRQLVIVLLSIAPAMIDDGKAYVGGMNFIFLREEGGEHDRPSLKNYLVILPENVVNWFRDDLFSAKMSPLILNHLDNLKGEDELPVHMLHLFAIRCRPKGWEKAIEKYMERTGSDSFFLLDTLQALMFERDFGSLSLGAEAEVTRLAKVATAKHSEGVKKPNKGAVSRITLREKKSRR